MLLLIKLYLSLVNKGPQKLRARYSIVNNIISKFEISFRNSMYLDNKYFCDTNKQDVMPIPNFPLIQVMLNDNEYSLS